VRLETALRTWRYSSRVMGDSKIVAEKCNCYN
jgi:hypothetical protein